METRKQARVREAGSGIPPVTGSPSTVGAAVALHSMAQIAEGANATREVVETGAAAEKDTDGEGGEEEDEFERGD